MGGEGRGVEGAEEKRGEEDKDRRSQEKKKGGWGGVSGTTVKWLRCYHGDSNEGSQDTLGGWRRRGLGRGGGGRRESDGEGDGESEIESWRWRKYKRPAGFFPFFMLRQTDYVDTHYATMLSWKCSL